MRHFYNLTTGLEVAPPGASFVRLQSSKLESRAFWSFMSDVDYDFLLEACTGHAVLHDCTTRMRSGEDDAVNCDSRVIFQGVPLIRYFLKREAVDMGIHWWSPPFTVKGHDCADFFAAAHARSHDAKRVAREKIKYVLDLTRPTSEPRVTGVSHPSLMDGRLRREIWGAYAERVEG